MINISLLLFSFYNMAVGGIIVMILASIFFGRKK